MPQVATNSKQCIIIMVIAVAQLFLKYCHKYDTPTEIVSVEITVSKQLRV